jgi:uncharacterized protein (TIGR00375 family)
LRLDCDFHIHSRYSGATSKNMTLDTISKQALLKGLDVVGTGDAIHRGWLEELKSLESCYEGVYEKNGCKFVITLEVEDARRVHHLIFLPSVAAAQGLRAGLKEHSEDIDKDGRPHVRLTGEEIVDFVLEVEGALGPSHAFVPWTSVYKEYNSLRECYGSNTRRIFFLELGLSADTELADYIAELKNITLLSNSDAHSPWPHRLGREFNRLEVRDISYSNIIRALRRRGNKVILNVGLDPRLGKYHRTACIRCHALYEYEDALRLHWRCADCGGVLKKGVRDRIRELSSYSEALHPEHRPPYMRIAPLAEILCLALKVKSIYSPRIQGEWKKLVKAFGSEISVLIDADTEDIKKVSGEAVGGLIRRYREGDFSIIQGGGGKYGRIVFNASEAHKTGRTVQGVLDQFGG